MHRNIQEPPAVILAAHYERRKDEKGEYVKFGNQDIDPQKTHLNYNLAPRRGLEQIDFIRQRTTEARTLKRDDVNVMCSWVVTLPSTATTTKVFM